MALVHKVQFGSIVEMVLEVVEVYTEFEPRDPLPAWWEKFEAWADTANISDAEQLEKKLEEIEKTKENRPDWWKLVEKAFKAAKSFKVVELRTEAFGSDGPDADADADAGGEDELAVESVPDDNEPGEDAEGEGEPSA